jgi:hypothetical protein
MHVIFTRVFFNWKYIYFFIFWYQHIKIIEKHLTRHQLMFFQGKEQLENIKKNKLKKKKEHFKRCIVCVDN